MSFYYNTRSKSKSKSKFRIFQCCGNRGLISISGGELKRLVCEQCHESWHDQCLKDEYHIKLSAVYKSKRFRCPCCVGNEFDKAPPPKKRKTDKYYDEDSDLEVVSNKSKKKSKRKKKSRKRRKSKPISDSDSIYSLSSSDSSEKESKSTATSRKAHKKHKLTKREKQKQKSIYNRLNNIDSKHGLKYSADMLNVSDTATDSEFDAANYYPDKPPETDKKLEKLRVKKAFEKHAIYNGRLINKSVWREFEKKDLIEILQSIAKDPGKYNYNAKYGFVATDMSVTAMKYLYELRKKNPEKYRDVPFRNGASISTKFRDWSKTKYKESADKNWISKFGKVKGDMKILADKGSSDVNKELVAFQSKYTKIKLDKAEEKIKKLESKTSITDGFVGAITDIKTMIKVITKKEPVKKEKIEQKQQEIECGDYNYTDYDGNDMDIDDKSPQPQSRSPTPPPPPVYPIDNCLNFLTEMNNLAPGGYDEVNEMINENVKSCEKALWDNDKCQKLTQKYRALRRVPNVNDVALLCQLAETAKLLLE